MKGVVLGGTASGVGKTVATLATIKALEDAGKSVQPAKAGPDFIDTSHHSIVTDTPSRTLDVWMQGEDGVRRNYHRGSGDIAVIEGVMGLYDGDASSTAHVAETLDLPVILVVDAKAGMESVAATALGFVQYAEQAGRDIDIVGILAQRAHGGRHEEGIREALPDTLEYFGRVPPSSDLEIPNRHLGLHMGPEAPIDAEALASAAKHIDGNGLLDAAEEPTPPPAREPIPEKDLRIAVASDPAFSFYYPATIERLREAGSVRTFSPLAGDAIPSCEAIYLPGGYPELHAETLAERSTVESIRRMAESGVPILGECGGLMTLSNSLQTSTEEQYEMAGILPADIQMQERYQALGHVELEAVDDTVTASRGEQLRGHEFHYSKATVSSDASFAFEVRRGSGIADGMDGLTEYRTLGTYTHVHPESGAFDSFLESI